MSFKSFFLSSCLNVDREKWEISGPKQEEPPILYIKWKGKKQDEMDGDAVDESDVVANNELDMGSKERESKTRWRTIGECSP